MINNNLKEKINNKFVNYWSFYDVTSEKMYEIHRLIWIHNFMKNIIEYFNLEISRFIIKIIYSYEK